MNQFKPLKTNDKDEGIAKLIVEVRRSGVKDPRILLSMESVPRDLFIPKTFQKKTYDDVALPIGFHQTVSQPSIVGRMTEALDVGDRMKVLEVGTGSGYQSAILSHLCRRLYTIERHPPLLKQAEARFKQLRLTNITSLLGDGSLGWPDQSPFDRIMLTAAAIDIPAQLVSQLAIGGTMIIPVGLDENDQRLIRLTKHNNGADTEDLGSVRFVPLLPGVELE